MIWMWIPLTLLQGSYAENMLFNEMILRSGRRLRDRELLCAGGVSLKEEIQVSLLFLV